MPIFNEIEARIARALEHANALNRELAAFSGSKSHELRPDKNADGSEHYFRVHFDPKPDLIRYGILFGEVVHQLRSALDNLANRLVEASGGTPTTNTGYPIFCKAREFRKKAPQMLAGIRPDLFAEVERYQPFQGGWDKAKTTPLWFVHDLDIMDKHKMLVPIVSGREKGGAYIPKGCSSIAAGTLEDGAIALTIIPPSPVPEMKVYFDLSYTVRVDIGQGHVRLGEFLREIPEEIHIITRDISNLV
jgi:hypothetical protein